MRDLDTWIGTKVSVRSGKIFLRECAEPGRDGVSDMRVARCLKRHMLGGTPFEPLFHPPLMISRIWKKGCHGFWRYLAILEASAAAQPPLGELKERIDVRRIGLGFFHTLSFWDLEVGLV
jgi:hypothetical protein